MISRLRCTVIVFLMTVARAGAGAQDVPARDVFVFVRALDDAGVRQVWPEFNASDWPLALFDGRQTILLRHPDPPREFTPMPGQPGVFAMTGRHPAVVGNSTRDIGGVRTATVIATPAQDPGSATLAVIEEVFHVFWLSRHTNFRPNEMARYAYPLTDRANLRRILAEDEALARALTTENRRASAEWVAAALNIRRERFISLSNDVRAFETALEMMEGTANYVARAAVGQKSEATAARLRAERASDQIRWRFYDSGTAICFLLDRFEPDWKTRIDSEHELTTIELLAAAINRLEVKPATFSASESARFEESATLAIAELSARQGAIRKDVLGRGGPRIIIDVAIDASPLRITRFDPINLHVLDGGEVIHPNYIALAGADGAIELTNPVFARDSVAGTVAITRAAGRHPLVDGIRGLTIVGVRSTPRVTHAGRQLMVEADGVRITLHDADVRTEGDTLRINIGGR